jgi:hypothetical protein
VLPTLSNINKVDATMDSIREQMDLTNEISDAISNPVNMGIDVDDVSMVPLLTETIKKADVFSLSTGGVEERAGGIGAGAVERPTDGCRESTSSFTNEGTGSHRGKGT